MDIHFLHNGQNFVATPVDGEIEAKQNFEIYSPEGEFFGEVILDFYKDPDAQLLTWSAYH